MDETKYQTSFKNLYYWIYIHFFTEILGKKLNKVKYKGKHETKKTAVFLLNIHE